ncbi:hypothetical protein ANN_09670 [Periplaneta americana]|uniref:Zinc finger MYM-type protein 1-like n=1 Tax=Periplaneta americana TaxID=6978 RepID=A0ABQ8TP82_PERAM|nr:hypothetical protein ANN_09670 [Periplaneta americana]
MQLSDQLKNEITSHDKKVEQTRELVKRFIHAVCFLSKQELAFRGHDESSTSINRGNYVELLKYTAEYDPLLKAHLETSTVFKGVSNRIQNDLIEAVVKSLLEEIKLEIKLANYVAVLVGEITDVSNTAQFSIVLWYIHNGQTKERFIGFQDVSQNRTDPEIAELIRQYLTEFDSNNKLIAQSYDGAASMAGRINGPSRKSIPRLWQLRLLGLISSENGKYDIYQKQFPQIEFSNLLSAYGNHFEEVRLRNELTVFYAADDFKEKNSFELLQIMSDKSISTCFPQLSKLISLICTIPVSTALVERSFSALKRIKTYSRNRTGEKDYQIWRYCQLKQIFLNKSGKRTHSSKGL